MRLQRHKEFYKTPRRSSGSVLSKSGAFGPLIGLLVILIMFIFERFEQRKLNDR